MGHTFIIFIKYECMSFISKIHGTNKFALLVKMIKIVHIIRETSHFHVCVAGTTYISRQRTYVPYTN